MITDRNGKELQVGDIVFYGERVNSKGSRGKCKVGTITGFNSQYVVVDSEYGQMSGSSLIKCSPKFANMFTDGSIFEI